MDKNLDIVDLIATHLAHEDNPNTMQCLLTALLELSKHNRLSVIYKLLLDNLERRLKLTPLRKRAEEKWLEIEAAKATQHIAAQTISDTNTRSADKTAQLN